ncbi:MAG: SDR family oxidoreductase [Actinomycetota bacterium]|nr:SDR family oxidoreductase [Actinomycetota bacterium]
MTTSVLITGGGGYVGTLLGASLSADAASLTTIVSADIREPVERLASITYVVSDIRRRSLVDLLTAHDIEVVVHLAAVVSPGRSPDRDREYSINVEGTRNVLECCLEAGVRKIIVSSSGAAYGYHADNPEWIDEADALRGNSEFAYSDHKRLVEEMLLQWRQKHPQLGQLIFRPGTILGASTQNQITDLFDRRVILGVSGSRTPFVFVWDQDVVGAIRQGILTEATGIYNLAGDGTLTLVEIANRMGKRYIALPGSVIAGALWLLRSVGATQYGPEQVDFLRYRPVLANRRLKEEFNYTPAKTTEEVFDLFWKARS